MSHNQDEKNFIACVVNRSSHLPVDRSWVRHSTTCFLSHPCSSVILLVVLGADSPLGQPLVLDLETRGYIVIASVATPEAVELLERQTQGYVKVLVLDPYEV